MSGCPTGCARFPDRRRRHGADIRFILPFGNAAPVVRMAGAGMKHIPGPDIGFLRKEGGEEMPRVERYEIAVDPLWAIIPDIFRCPWVAGDDFCPLFLDDGKQALSFQ